MKHKIEYRYLVAAIYTAVLFLDRLDLTIVNIILPTLANYFKVPITHTEWVNNAFLLALAISIPVSGWAGGRFGIKRVFILATALFGLASLLCAFAPNLLLLVLLRFLQGIGGGILIPVGMAMVYRAFAPAEYASITSFIFIPTLVAPAIAPTLGGLIMYVSSWKWVFLFAAPICLIAVILSIIILQEQKIKDTAKLDWGGFILSASALILILTCIANLGRQGLNLSSLMLFIAAISSSYLFLSVERRVSSPLIDIAFFRHQLFVQANLIQLAFQICHFGAIFLIGMYLQVGVGMSAVVAGMIMGMQALGAICISRFSVTLFNRFGPGLPIISGLLGVAICTPLILLINQPSMAIFGMLLLFIRGLSSGLCGTPIQTCSVIGFDRKQVSRASAIFNASRQVSISLGIALSSILISYGFKLHPGNQFAYAFAFIPIVALLGILVTLRIDNQQVLRWARGREGI